MSRVLTVPVATFSLHDTVVRNILTAFAVVLALIATAGHGSAGDVSSASSSQPLRVRNATLQSVPQTNTNAPPSTLLKFELMNGGVTTVGNVRLQLSVQERRTDTDHEPQIRVRPFIVQGRIALEPGYTANFEMVLRNFDGVCDCVPKVEIMPPSIIADGGS